MPLIMRCDAPNCGKETAAIATPAGRIYPAQDDGWWFSRTGDGRSICACCDDHLHVAFATKPVTIYEFRDPPHRNSVSGTTQ